MSVLIKHMTMPKGCIYANDKDQTEYCPLLNHDDVPFCQYVENEPEIAIGIDERPVYCPLSEAPEPCEDAIYRQAAIDAIGEKADEIYKTKQKGATYPHDDFFQGMAYAENIVKQLPSAQPERKKGKWNCGDDMFEYAICSVCKWDSGEAWEYAKKYFRYCPSCGADMRGE